MERLIQEMKEAVVKSTHDLRTPTAALCVGTHVIKQYLPKLISGYETAKSNNLEVQEIPPIHLKTLSEMLARMEGQCHSIEKMLVALKNKVTTF